MTRTQQYIAALLDRLPRKALSNPEHESIFEKLRDKLGAAPDVREELKQLFKVKNFSDFALRLMWVADSVEKDSSRTESTLEEETMVFSAFRSAVGEPGVGLEADARALESVFASEPTTGEPQETPSASVPTDLPPQPEPAVGEVVPQAMSAVGGEEQVQQFSALLDKFLEAVQSGSDDRTPLLEQLVTEAKVVAGGESLPEDYRQYCQHLSDFLAYIFVNQLLDDVRVMNLTTNIQDSFAQWSKADPSARAGLLDPGIEVLRDFKTMFE
ncbi:MAG: hypothetical protein WBD36_15925 [Bacteroidota bacterium]